MLRTTLVTIALAIVFFVAERYAQVPWLHPAWKAMLIFFLSMGFLMHRLVDIGLQGDREQFVPMYLGATVARLVLSLLLTGVFLYQGVADRRTFVFDFLALYIFYTGFEIWTVSRNLRRDS